MNAALAKPDILFAVGAGCGGEWFKPFSEPMLFRLLTHIYASLALNELNRRNRPANASALVLEHLCQISFTSLEHDLFCYSLIYNLSQIH